MKITERFKNGDTVTYRIGLYVHGEPSPHWKEWKTAPIFIDTVIAIPELEFRESEVEDALGVFSVNVEEYYLEIKNENI